MITVLVVDDHARVRETLVELLDEADDVAVVGECADGDEVLAAYRSLLPDVVLMDVVMQRVDGLTATRGLLTECPEARVVLLTGTVSATLVRQALECGAAGYQVKGDDPTGLVDTIRHVAHGGTAWSPRAMALLPHHDGGGTGADGAVAP